MSKTNKKLLIFSLFLFIIFSSLSLIKTDYYFMSPGPPYQWDIDYGDAENFDFEGNLYQLTVRRDEANALIYAWSYISNSVDLYPREVILPKGVSPEELSQISIQNMKTSENVAIAVALKYLGYDITSKGDGVSVVGILDDSPVKDKLKRGDLLNSINNDEISSASEFIAMLRTYDIGDTVKIGLIRDVEGNLKNLEIETKLIEHVEYEGEPMVGFLATTVNERFDFPFEIDIKTGLNIVSLHGKNRKYGEIDDYDLNEIDILIFDIQDVGVRFYTHISTLHYVMEASARKNIPLIVMDRPNPNAH